MIINHNLAGSNAIRQMNTNSTNASKSMQKLSSGLRINSASDDAAGLAISEKMRGQIRGLDQASTNAQDGISLTQTAEGALNETTSILQRMRELAVQGSNDTLNSSDRGQIQKETDQLTAEIDRISSTTQFNTKNLLDGSLGAKRDASAGVTEGQANVTNGITAAQVASVSGVFTNDKVGTHVVTFSVGVAGEEKSAQTALNGTETLASLGVTDIAGLKVGKTGSETAITGLTLNSTVADLVSAINSQSTGATGATAALVNGQMVVNANTAGNALNILQTTASAGSLANVMFTAGAGNANIASTNEDASKLTITDKYTDAGGKVSTTVDRTGADGTANITYNGVTFTKGTGSITTASVTMQGLNAKDSLSARADNSLSFQIGANENQTMKVDIEDMSSTALGIKVGGNNIDLSTGAKATAAITTINNAIEKVSSERSKLGAFQNRLEHTISNLGTSSENLTSAESRIRDVDMAKEMSTFSKNNILSQAAQAMLAQANQQPQQVLQLLR